MEGEAQKRRFRRETTYITDGLNILGVKFEEDTMEELFKYTLQQGRFHLVINLKMDDGMVKVGLK